MPVSVYARLPPGHSSSESLSSESSSSLPTTTRTHLLPSPKKLLARVPSPKQLLSSIFKKKSARPKAARIDPEAISPPKRPEEEWEWIVDRDDKYGQELADYRVKNTASVDDEIFNKENTPRKKTWPSILPTASHSSEKSLDSQLREGLTVSRLQSYQQSQASAGLHVVPVNHPRQEFRSTERIAKANLIWQMHPDSEGSGNVGIAHPSIESPELTTLDDGIELQPAGSSAELVNPSSGEPISIVRVKSDYKFRRGLANREGIVTEKIKKNIVRVKFDDGTEQTFSTKSLVFLNHSSG